jgi:hypothetical protein
VTKDVDPRLFTPNKGTNIPQGNHRTTNKEGGGGDTPNGICLISYPQTRGHFLARTNFLSSLELTIGAKQNEDIMNEKFDLKPKEELYIYRRSYHDWFDKMSLPP